MTRLIVSLTFAALILSGAAYAGELDNYYLEQFGESPESGALLKSTGPEGARRCGMPLRRELRRDWAKLESSTQRTLSKNLARPALSNEGIVKSNGGHFHIHYASVGTDAPPLADNDTNGIPDWIEQVADVFEAVYAREVQLLGFREPPDLPYDIYLQQLGGQREFGFTQSETVTGRSATSYIVVDNDFLDQVFQNSIPGSESSVIKARKALQITAAHEYHHAIQFGYNFYFETWYAEATATWIEDEVYNSVNQLYDYLVNYYLRTDLQLDTGVNITTGGGYGRWSFNRYLTEASQPSAIVRNSWETLATKSPINGADIPMIPVLEEVVASNAGGLPSLFLGFSKRFLLNDWASHQSDKNFFPSLIFGASNTHSALTTFSVPAVGLPAYAFRYLKILPTSPVAEQLTINYPAKPAAYSITALLASNGAISQFPADNSGTIIIPSASSADTIYLLICNNVSGTATSPAEPFQQVLPLDDATNPFTGNATVVLQPNTNTGGGGGGGGGGGCFIATAAYGSYLHPKVMVLRNFRDNYLLTNEAGRLFVSLYYKYSPAIADLVRQNDTARLLVRVMLAPLIFLADHFVLALYAFSAGIAICGGLQINRRRARRVAGACGTP